MSRRIAGFLLLVLALILLPFFLWGQALTEFSAEWLGSDRPDMVIAAMIVLLLALDVVLPTPSSLVAVAAGVYFGFVTAALLIASGMIIGSLLGYLLGRVLSQRLLRGLLDARDTERTSDFFSRYGLLALTLVRPLPVLAEASVILAGTSRLSLSTVLIYTLPANVVIAVAYAGGTVILERAPVVSLAVLGVAVLSVAVLALVHHRRQWRPESSSPDSS